MAAPVKRTYSSAKRQQQAETTRVAILQAARTLFVAQGYAATTIQAIADEAGVAVQTVYAVFKNKRQLLDHLIETAIAGSADPGAELAWTEDVEAVAAEPDPRRRMAMDAAMSRAITERVAPVVRIAQEAASADPEFAVEYEAMKARRRAEMTTMVKLLAGRDQMRLSTSHAAATLYVLYSPQVADMLMGDYGWSATKYEKWLADMLYQSLFGD